MQDQKQVTFFTSEKFKNKIKSEAHKEEMNMSEFIRNAITYFIAAKNIEGGEA